MKRSTLFALALTLVGCTQVLDIEEPSFNGGPVSGDCGEYCANAKMVCAETGFRAFETDANCTAVCKRYEPGTSPTGNTLACRAALLESASRIGEGTGICQAAGPGGSAATNGTSASCGSNCESYCALRVKVCASNLQECLRQCPALPDKGSFDAPKDFGGGEDTIQCRLSHLTVAATYQEAGGDDNEKQRAMHCEHSDIRSRNRGMDGVLGDGTCDAVDPTKLKCDDYCKMTSFACAQNPVYESNAQCLALCGKLEAGKTDLTDSTKVDTLRCRREGAYEALRSPNPLACMNAGPAPDRCGTGKCDSYCELAQKTCSTQFAATFAGGKAECLTKCSALPGAATNAPYNVTAEQAKRGATLQCRLLRLARAAETPTDAVCAEVMGKGACE